MKTDYELQQDVLKTIQWEPLINAAEIGVTAKDGLVTLSGMVDNFAIKINAEIAAKNVLGVKIVAGDLIVNYRNSKVKDDTNIAEKVLESWQNNKFVSDANISIKVKKGWLKLEGEVEQHFQKVMAGNILINLPGVMGVKNLIVVKSNSIDSIVQKDIEQALDRNWALYPLDIKVDVKTNKVKLTGLVYSIYQKEEAGRLTWNALGVCSVENDLALI